jgi:heterodisulfide reductase subunit A-like polyferredoxin
VRYSDNDRPVVEIQNPEAARRQTPARLVVHIPEHIVGETLEIAPDLIVLSMSIMPDETAATLARTLHVPLSSDGFFMEAHLKMRPMDFMEEGIFLAGLAHYPKFIEECIANALAAAGRALTVLSKETLFRGGSVAVVDSAKCISCLTCARTCPFGIPQVRTDRTGVGGLSGAAWIDPARCQGCGTCTAECPAKAIQLLNYLDEQIISGVGRWEVETAAGLQAMVV